MSLAPAWRRAVLGLVIWQGLFGCTGEQVGGFVALPEGDWALLMLVADPRATAPAEVLAGSELQEGAFRIPEPEDVSALLIGLERSALVSVHPEVDGDRLAEARWIVGEASLSCAGDRISESTIRVPVDARFSLFELPAGASSFTAAGTSAPLPSQARVELPLRFGLCLGQEPVIRPFGASSELLANPTAPGHTTVLEILPVDPERVVVRFLDGVALVERGGTIERGSSHFFSLPQVVFEAAFVQCKSPGDCEIVVALTPTGTSTLAESGVQILEIEPDGLRPIRHVPLARPPSDIELDARSGIVVVMVPPETLLSAPEAAGPYSESTLPSWAYQIFATVDEKLPELLLYGEAGNVLSIREGGSSVAREKAISAEFGGTRVTAMIETVTQSTVYAGGRNGELAVRDPGGAWRAIEYLLPPSARNCASAAGEDLSCGRLRTGEWIRSLSSVPTGGGRELLVWPPAVCTALFAFDPQRSCTAVIPAVSEKIESDQNQMQAVARMGDSLLVGGERGLLLELSFPQ